MSCSSSAVSRNINTEKEFQANDYFGIPYLPQDSSQGIIIVELDQSIGMLQRAYSSSHFDAESNDGQVGYFNPQSQYRYNANKNYFEEDATLVLSQKEVWDGQFLNWLLMRQMDMVRHFLLGAQKEQDLDASEHKLVLQLTNSVFYSPIPNATTITLESGKLQYQGKSFQLRLKNLRQQKGLLDLLTDNVSFYFYAQKTTKVQGYEKQAFIFGDAQKLPSYLKRWTASNTSNNTSQKSYKDDAFQRALNLIKQRSFKNKKDSEQENTCQRYVYISLVSGSDMAQHLRNDDLLSDCQKELEGKQALTYFQLKALGKYDSISQNNFTLHDLDTLKRSIFDALVGESEHHSYQMSGADIESFADNSGAIYQSVFKYADKNSHETLKWIGDLRAVLIDEQGRLRSDNGDRKLGSLDEDPLVSSCFDEENNLLRLRFITKPDFEENCNPLNYPYFEKDLGYLWQASDAFRDVSQTNSVWQRSSFQGNHSQRYLRTNVGQTEYDFVEGGTGSDQYPFKPEWLNVGSQAEANKLINFVRGQDQEGFRERHLEQKHYMLGDTANSSPIVVGKPSSNYHLLYGDQSYQTFLKQYHDRRSRVFLGANDGLLHSFNAGWFDSKTKQLKNSPTNSQWKLGQETWAFVPFSVLPYLSELSDKYYGVSPYHHLKVSPQKPYVFDARIFDGNKLIGQKNRVFNAEDGNLISHQTHPKGWATLMVIGVGLGRSSYLIFDITDAEQAPKLLAELNVNNKVNMLSLPTVMTQKNKQGQLEWHLAIGMGSGIYIYNLQDIQSEEERMVPTIIDLKEHELYVTGISAADWNLDGETDALYLNTTNVNRNTGSLYRVHIQNKSSNKDAFETEKLLAAEVPLIERPQLSMDALNNRWIYLSTGQINQSKSAYIKSIDITYKHKIIGIKEPRNSQGSFLVELSQASSGKISLKSLLDVSDILVDAQKGTLSGSWSIHPRLTTDTVGSLESRLMQYSDGSDYVDGWVRYLDKNEVATGPSKLFGGILTQSSYQAGYENCSLFSEAFIHRLRFTTGTSWYSQTRNANLTKKIDAELKATKSDSFGSAELSSTLLQEGSEQLHQIQSSKNGQSQTSSEESHTLMKSGEVSWREL